MGIQTTREVSTRFSKYHVVPMHNSTAEDGKQNHTMALALPRSDDMDETDLEVTEIVEGLIEMLPKTGSCFQQLMVKAQQTTFMT